VFGASGSTLTIFGLDPYVPFGANLPLLGGVDGMLSIQLPPGPALFQDPSTWNTVESSLTVERFDLCSL
jgi:hypothetical protein